MVNFPEVEDVILERAPLTEVIAQVRFPPVLRIAEETPASFQEAIRTRLPHFSQEQELSVQLPTKVEKGKYPAVQVQQTNPVYRFQSPDTKTTATLAVDFYALSTKAYQHWEDFWALIQLVNGAVQDVYSPNHAMRVGLRYINQITLRDTPLGSVDELRDLANPALVELFQQPPWNAPIEMLNRLLLQGDQDEDRLMLRFGLKTQGESLLLLDFDYFQEGQIPFEGLEAFYRRAHDIIYRAFRWSVKERALSIFGPLEEV